MRRYQAIWNRLKKLSPNLARSAGIAISANPILHSRIIKAVKKEKYKDLEYKLMIDPKDATLTHKVNGSILIFYLNLSLTEGDF